MQVGENKNKSLRYAEPYNTHMIKKASGYSVRGREKGKHTAQAGTKGAPGVSNKRQRDDSRSREGWQGVAKIVCCDVVWSSKTT